MQSDFGVILTDRYAHVIGLGLIGCSVSLALGRAGWKVTGEDIIQGSQNAAMNAQIIESTVIHPAAELVFIACPADSVIEVVERISPFVLRDDAVISDVAGVKESIVQNVRDPRFIGGHPMAGSELRGLEGARGDMFDGCTWIITPTSTTNTALLAKLHGYIREFGASVVAVEATDHDRLVAIASHVPHVIAGTLMNHAAVAAKDDAVLLQLAAGGFRDMTRIAAGDPTMWPDVLFQNSGAITQALAAIEVRLQQIRTSLVDGNRDDIVAMLTSASYARRQLPGRALESTNLAYIRIPISDRPGVLAEVTMIASDLGINIFDIEISHGIEGAHGTLLLAVDRDQIQRFSEALASVSYVVARES